MKKFGVIRFPAEGHYVYMQCSKCGNENRENLPACPECGEALEPQAAPPSQQPESATAPQYAGFTERSLALLCDLFVACVLALPLILITGQIFEGGRILFFAVLVLYMTAAQYFFHTTLGKRLFGLQIRTATKTRPYPDLLELLCRESAGKYLCQWWIGQGFLVATYDAMHMTWADRLAGTVVVKALPVSRKMKIARILLLVLAGLVLALMLAGLMFGA
jgi:uncharacterized RDD family membrane protein YckC